MQNPATHVELPKLRRQKILLILERDGKVVANELSEHFGVSEDTIRRDLADLASEGLLQRVHGGALPRPRETGRDYFTRLDHTDEIKRAVAQQAAKHARDGQIVLFDSGTTVLEIARSLPATIALTAITASPMVAVVLAEYRNIQVILGGGQLNAFTLSTQGPETLRLVQGVKADLLFTGVCALHPQVGISTPHFEEVALKQALLASASQVVAVAAADKLGAVEPFMVAPCERLHTLYTGPGLPAAEYERYRQLGVQVHTPSA